MQEIEARIVEALATVRAQSTDELQLEVDAGGGNLEIDSREAEAVIAMLEALCGHELAEISDLEPENLASIKELAKLVEPRWSTDGGA